MAELSALAAGLSQHLGLGPFETSRLSIQTETIEGPDAPARVAQSISAAKPIQGWIWGDETGPAAWLEGDPPAMPGHIFAAQMLLANGESLHVRHLDGDRWLKTIYREGDGEELLVEAVSQLAASPQRHGLPENAMLDYRRFWLISDGEASRVVAARFVGFGGGK